MLIKHNKKKKIQKEKQQHTEKREGQTKLVHEINQMMDIEEPLPFKRRKPKNPNVLPTE